MYLALIQSSRSLEKLAGEAYDTSRERTVGRSVLARPECDVPCSDRMWSADRTALKHDGGDILFGGAGQGTRTYALTYVLGRLAHPEVLW